MEKRLDTKQNEQAGHDSQRNLSGQKWYHGSNVYFLELRAGSTITQWRALAEAFSHRPKRLSCEDDGRILHNGTEDGYLYEIDEPVVVGKDCEPHPRTTMEAHVEFLTSRPLKVRLIAELPASPDAPIPDIPVLNQKNR